MPRKGELKYKVRAYLRVLGGVLVDASTSQCARFSECLLLNIDKLGSMECR